MAFRAPDGANDNDNDNNCQGNNGGRVLFLVQPAYRWTIDMILIKKETVFDKIFYFSVKANDKLQNKTQRQLCKRLTGPFIPFPGLV